MVSFKFNHYLAPLCNSFFPFLMAIIEVVDFALLAIALNATMMKATMKVIFAPVSKVMLTTNWLELKL